MKKNVAYEYDQEGNLSFDETPIHKIGYRIDGKVLDEDAFETRYQPEIENKTLLCGPSRDAYCVLSYTYDKGWSVTVDGEYVLEDADRDQAVKMVVYQWMDAFAVNRGAEREMGKPWHGTDRYSVEQTEYEYIELLW